jgi:hypothetical protein
VFGYLGGGALPFDLKTIVSLGPKTIVSGTLTTCLMGAMVGVLN